MLRLKRVYDPVDAADGVRLLVDRLWPRGLTKELAALDGWAKDLSPSDELRRWYHQNREEWDAFVTRYREELADPDKAAQLRELAARARVETLTLLFSAKDPERNNAAVLKAVLEEMP